MAETRDASTSAAERELVITRVFDAPRELVWKAWTDPELAEQWSGPRGFTSKGFSLDPLGMALLDSARKAFIQGFEITAIVCTTIVPSGRSTLRRAGRHSESEDQPEPAQLEFETLPIHHLWKLGRRHQR